MASSNRKRESIRKVWPKTFNISQEKLEDIPIHCPLSIKQEKYLNDDKNDILVWGGSAGAGKTSLSLLLIQLMAGSDPNFVAAIARKTQKMMKSAGSLWSTGCRLARQMKAKVNSQELTWNFPNGAEVKCHHLDNNQDDWQGTQCTQFLVDEGQQCQEDDVWYLTSRLRSQSDSKHQLRITCNPQKESYLCRWLSEAGYLDENGFPNPEMDGVTTYMIQYEGEFKWYKSLAAVKKECGKEIADSAQKFVFYSANVFDNPYIRKHRPEYITKLQNMKPIERARLLEGCWYIDEKKNGFIKREWFKPLRMSDLPLGLPEVRCWDLAGTAPHPGNRNPDWTRGVKAQYDRNTASFYVMDMKSIRDRAAIVQSLIEKAALEDGAACSIGIPQDMAAAGKEVAATKTSRLASKGFKAYTNKTRGSKLVRGEMFLIALQEGRVYVADGVFSEVHYDELESFDGGKNSGRKDDIWDAMVDAYNLLTSGNLVPTIKIGNHMSRLKQMTGNTLLG